MAVNGTILLDTGIVLNDDRLPGSDIQSYKCEDCGKIIAAPADRPAPWCCDNRMRQIG